MTHEIIRETLEAFETLAPPMKPLWQADPARIAAMPITRFGAFCAARSGRAFGDYRALHRWSVQDAPAFWSACWDFLRPVGEKGRVALAPHSHISEAPFFPEARINYAENLLADFGARPALIFHGEDGRRAEMSRAALIALVSRLVQAMQAEGVSRGDRVAGFVPNMPESIAAMLACTAIGAIWSSCSPDFGAAAVEDRFGQIAPRILIAADGYFYNGKRFDSRPVIAQIAERLPSLSRIVVFPYAMDGAAPDSIPKAVSWERFLAPFAPAAIEYAPMGFRDPAFILFSSGTTGKPKCIIHSGGGLLLQHMKEHRLHGDLRTGDRFFYFATCGWMMWNWLVSGLASGAELVLYDGNPVYPDPARLAHIAQMERISHFGVSARYIEGCMKERVTPRTTHDLRAMRAVFSTGSPLSPDAFDSIYRDWKAEVHLASISGGTDICACFIGGVPTLPVWRGEIQAPLLGLDVAVFNKEGKPARGEAGELVCRNAHPSMPVGFFNDANGERYRKAYFTRFPSVWHHGDYLLETAHGGYVVEGRSDATLNPGGVRIGTAEIYRQLETIPAVQESVVIGQRWQGDVRVVLFVKLTAGATLDAALEAQIRRQIRTNATPRHVPARIIAVPDIPRTRSGKIVELAVRDVVHGKPVQNKGALANPEALAFFEGHAALEV